MNYRLITGGDLVGHLSAIPSFSPVYEVEMVVGIGGEVVPEASRFWRPP